MRTARFRTWPTSLPGPQYDFITVRRRNGVRCALHTARTHRQEWRYMALARKTPLSEPKRPARCQGNLPFSRCTQTFCRILPDQVARSYALSRAFMDRARFTRMRRKPLNTTTETFARELNALTCMGSVGAGACRYGYAAAPTRQIDSASPPKRHISAAR